MNILDFFDQDIQDRNFNPSLFLIFQSILATFKYAKVSTKNPHFPPGGFHLIATQNRQALLPTLTRAQQVLPMGWGEENREEAAKQKIRSSSLCFCFLVESI